jgi:hypothetical protein
MSSTNIVLPNEVIRLILLHCQSPKDYLSQSLVNRQWSCEARWIKSLMKRRFARKMTLLNYRLIMWHFDIRVTVLGHGEHLQRHGLEECVQTYHRVGEPGASVYYLERHWQEGKLHGLEILREINEIWYSKYYSKQKEISDEHISHPYNGLHAVDSMRKYGKHLIVPRDGILPKGCDYLGKILFKYEWMSGTLEESKQLKRNLINEQDQSDISGLYDFIHEIDLHEISTQHLPV